MQKRSFTKKQREAEDVQKDFHLGVLNKHRANIIHALTSILINTQWIYWWNIKWKSMKCLDHNHALDQLQWTASLVLKHFQVLSNTEMTVLHCDNLLASYSRDPNHHFQISQHNICSSLSIKSGAADINLSEGKNLKTNPVGSLDIWPLISVKSTAKRFWMFLPPFTKKKSQPIGERTSLSTLPRMLPKTSSKRKPSPRSNLQMTSVLVPTKAQKPMDLKLKWMTSLSFLPKQ